MAEGHRALDLIKDTSISYLVQLVLNKVFSCLQSGVGSLLGHGDELEKIKSSLYTILSAVGSAEERPLKDLALVDWLEKLKDAAYDAEDVLDEYATEEVRRKVEAHNSNSVRDLDTNKVRKITSSLPIDPVVNHEMMTKKLKEIRKRLESIEDKSHRFQLSERVLNRELEFKEHIQTYSFVDESEVYGRNEDREKIVNLLVHAVAGHEDEKVSVIPIVGMGGLGKTTLAQFIFSDDRVTNHFELKMWVCVSDDFDVKRLMGKIIRRATGSNISDVSDLEELQHRALEALNERRFLLVLDDVWNEEPEKWNRLRILLLMCGGRGSRIVVTTRNPMVASIMSKIGPYYLEGLSEKDCWKLFARRAFYDRGEEDHKKLAEIGIDIVRKCKGVPLAVKTMGGLLSFKGKESEWVFIRDSEFWNLAPAEYVYGILPALRLSYYHLNPHQRQCFAFCAIFPKDYRMGKELLIQLWMAHECVPSRRGMELEDIGIEILNELLRRSLFQEGEENYEIKVHDLVHDLAQSVMGDDCCIIENDKSVNISRRVRHLSFYQTNSPITPPDVHEAPLLRTLLELQVCDFVVPWDMTIFKFLRVLDLQFSYQLPLLTSLGELVHLRYLAFVNASIDTLPESISSLQNLQTLKLHYCFQLQELPKGIRNLINLRCLDIRSQSLNHMPAEIGKLSCLRKLPLFVVGDSVSDCSGIEELRCLNYLRGNLMIEHLERVTIPSNAQRANLIGKPNLDRLELRWEDNHPLKIEAEEEEVLRGLKPNENLKELGIIGYGGIHFPSWMMGSFLPSIEKITLLNCRRCELLPPLGQLPLLKILRIEGMDCMENIGSEFYDGNGMSEVFPSLETLEVVSISHLKVWSGLHGKRVFPRLVELEIVKCPMLTTIACFPHLAALQKLSIMNCDKLANLPDELQYLTSVQILKISHCIDLKSLPEGIENLSSLKELEIKNVGLTSLPRGIGKLLSLHILDLSELKSLASLPESMQELSTLRQLRISSCPLMVSLPIGPQCLTGLQSLFISKCPELQRRYDEDGPEFYKILHIPEVEIS